MTTVVSHIPAELFEQTEEVAMPRPVLDDQSTRLRHNNVCFCTAAGTAMTLVENDTRLVCPACNRISDTYTDISELRVANTSKRPAADAKVWRMFSNYWLPIFAGDEWDINKHITKANLQRLNSCINVQGYNTALARSGLTCETLRTYMGMVGLPSTLNAHTTAILIHLGVAPPYKPTQAETEMVFTCYTLVINTYDKLKERLPELQPGMPSRENNINRPYYIYKIVQALFRHHEKMQTLLPFIHLQQHNTVQANDRIWQFICAELRIEYIPTQAR